MKTCKNKNLADWIEAIQQEISIENYAAEIREGTWCRSPYFCYWRKPFHEICYGQNQCKSNCITENEQNPNIKQSVKTVILDAFTVTEKDLSWDCLNKYSEVIIYDNTTPDQVVERCADAEIVLINKVSITEEMLEKLPKLKYVGVLATGYNIIDIPAFTKRGVTVTNIPAYSTDSVVQMTWAHICHIIQQSLKSASVLRYEQVADFLAGKTLGIVGMGRIGCAVAGIANEMGMKVTAYTSRQSLPDGIESVNLDKLLSISDIISLHCPLRQDNKEIINLSSLSKMKKSAFLINTGRGGLVNESDLCKALNDGVISAYGADVLTREPALSVNPLLGARNCFLTPHIAWATVEARQRLISICDANIRAYLSGKPVNVVSL